MTRDTDLPGMAGPGPDSKLGNPATNPTTTPPSEDLCTEVLARAYRPLSNNGEDITAAAMAEALEAALTDDGVGAGTLFRHAQLLDTLFYRVAMKAMDKPGWVMSDGDDYLDLSKLEFAARLQNLSRLALHTRHIVQHGSEQGEKDGEKNAENDERTEG